MKYLIFILSFISLLICQTNVGINNEVSGGLAEIFEYDTNGRVVSSKFISHKNYIPEREMGNEFPSIQEGNSDLMEIFEYDTNGRVVSSKFISHENYIPEREMGNEFPSIQEGNSDLMEIFEYDTNGRIVK